eukprot:752264-Alexandrium_andersonii.AAC.1
MLSPGLRIRMQNSGCPVQSSLLFRASGALGSGSADSCSHLSRVQVGRGGALGLEPGLPRPPSAFLQGLPGLTQ